MKKNKILLSIITPTLNNEKQIKYFLDTIRKQYSSGFNLEIIIVDGGSKDRTIEIAKKYKTRLIKNPFVLADPGVDLGIKNAKGDLLMILAVDNIFNDKNSLDKMIKVFEDKEITAAFPIHFSSANDSIFTKYINTFTDPFNHFVYGYAANGRTFDRVYKTLNKNNNYSVFDLKSSKNKPLIAVAQGFTVRGGFTRSSNSKFDDVLPVVELINKRKKIAFVHSVKLYHHTVRDLSHFLNKQMWATINALQGKKYGIAHRIDYLSNAQKLRTRIWPFYALSFVFPLVRGVYGLLRDREPMWIFHPILCMISACTSLVAGFIYFFNRSYIHKRQ